MADESDIAGKLAKQFFALLEGNGFLSHWPAREVETVALLLDACLRESFRAGTIAALADSATKDTYIERTNA